MGFFFGIGSFSSLSSRLLHRYHHPFLNRHLSVCGKARYAQHRYQHHLLPTSGITSSDDISDGSTSGEKTIPIPPPFPLPPQNGIRSFHTTTLCLKKKKKMITRRPARKPTASIEDRRKKDPMAGMSLDQKIKYLKEEIAKKEDPNYVDEKIDEDLGKKFVMKSGPSIRKGLLYSPEEGYKKLKQLWLELIDGVQNGERNFRDKVARTRVVQNLKSIDNGLYTTWELAGAIRILVATEIKDNRLKNLEKMVSKSNYLIAENFGELVQEEIIKLPLEIQQKLNTAIKLNIEENADGIARYDRMEDTILADMYPHDREGYTKKKQEVMFQIQRGGFTHSFGRSMEPTLMSGSTYQAIPLLLKSGGTPPITTKDLERGDLVTAVVTRPRPGFGWKTQFITKRIRGLSGDIMTDINGRRLRVPQDHYWLEGDNPEMSRDSRDDGSIPLINLRAKVDTDTIENPGEKQSLLENVFKLFTGKSS